MVLNKSLQVCIVMVCMANLSVQLIKQQEINVQNMNVELVAQMFKNYQSNVLFHLEGQSTKLRISMLAIQCHMLSFFTDDNNDSHRQPKGAGVIVQQVCRTIIDQHIGTRLFRYHVYLGISWRARGDARLGVRKSI